MRAYNTCIHHDNVGEHIRTGYNSVTLFIGLAGQPIHQEGHHRKVLTYPRIDLAYHLER
jgi:hypothetical protein